MTVAKPKPKEWHGGNFRHSFENRSFWLKELNQHPHFYCSKPLTWLETCMPPPVTKNQKVDFIPCSNTASPTVALKTPFSWSLNRQNKHRNTNQNAMTAIWWVFISLSSVLKLRNFGFSFVNLINRHSHYKCTAHHTNWEDGKPVRRFSFTT